MASEKKSGNSGIFWMNGVSDEEQPLVFLPGVEGDVKTRRPLSGGPGSAGTSNKRSPWVRVRRSSDFKSETTLKKNGKQSGIYSKEKVSDHHNVSTDDPRTSAAGRFHPLTQVNSETSGAKSLVCLKDLCPEDKRRIANLIEELARVSEEKEVSVQRLKDEQGNFERKIQQLEQQNLMIAHERESLQQQYKECQELLRLYQLYLSQQQARLNQSIAQLSEAPAHSKVLSSEEAPSRTSTSKANGSLFDGSYLGLAAAQAQQPQVHRSGGGRGGEAQTFSNPASLSCVSEFISTDGPKQHRSQKRESREPRSESHSRCEHCQGGGQDSGYETQQRKPENGSHPTNGRQNTSDQHNSEMLRSASAIGSEAKQALTRPLLGHEDWEEKRHQLLLQKMQLEMERERLHARLAEQEERLNRQNEQLRQSCLDYSRLPEVTQSDLPSSSNTRNGDPPPHGPSHQDLHRSVCQDAELHPAGRSLHEKHSQTASARPDNGDEALELSRKDTATSSAKSPAKLSKSTSVPVIQKTPEARSDFSLVELLEIFSPVSAPVPRKPSARKTKTPQRKPPFAVPKPLGRSLLIPAGPYPQNTQQDLEESHILEDIFFIC